MERKVLAARIAVPPSSSDNLSGSDSESKSSTPMAGGGGGFRLGSKVECKTRGSDRWVAGTILSANSDATFDIRLENGTEATKVSEFNIRAKPGTVVASSLSRPTLSRDTTMGGDRSMTPTRGSVGVSYDSDRDFQVTAPSVSATTAVLSIGDSVEVNKNGDNRWVSAKITS
eukprot:gene33059-40802_t